MSQNKETKVTTPVWGPEQSTPLNDPDQMVLYQGILRSGDPITRNSHQSVALYNETMADDQVISTFQQRKRAVLSAPLMVEQGADDARSIACADAFRDNLDDLNMYDITDKSLNVLFYGYMPGENLWKPHEGLIVLRDIKVRKPERFLYDQDFKLRMLTKDDRVRGVETDPTYFWSMSTGAISHDNPYGLGLGYYLYWLTRFKKSGIKFWLKFLEKFAQPSVVGKFPKGATQQDIDKLLDTVRALATDFGAAIPDDMVIDMIEASRSGTADYKAFRDIINASISKIVLSQTMTTDDGSSRSQSETHQNVKNDVVKGDSVIWCEAFKRSVARVWTEVNYPGAAVPILKRDIEPKQSTEDMARSDKAIGELGWELTEEKFIEKYGEGYQKKEVPEILTGALEKPEEDDDDTPSFAAGIANQELIDEALDEFLETDANDLSEQMLGELLEFASQHTPQETLAELDKLLPESKVDAFEEAIARAMVAGAVIGRENG